LPPKPHILIVCEGEKTEPNYFNGLRQVERLHATRVLEIVGGDEAGTHPKSIVKYAKEKKAELRPGDPKYDAIWCVFDRDDHERIHEAFVMAEANGFKVAFSNESFELWILLHYKDQRGAMGRRQLLREVKKEIPGYEKGMKNIYALTIDKQSDAISRAKTLRLMHNNNGSDKQANPSSTVDKLVEYLLSLTA